MKNLAMLVFVLSFLFEACGNPNPPNPNPTPVQFTITTSGGNAGLAPYLSDSSGISFYLFQGDTPGVSNCDNANPGCSAMWPPVVVATGTVLVAAGGAQSALLGTTTRANGSTQVTYNGWPLYYYSGDTGPGMTNGENLNSYGNAWNLISTSGNPQ